MFVLGVLAYCGFRFLVDGEEFFCNIYDYVLWEILRGF
jgi:hypothetical protein